MINIRESSQILQQLSSTYSKMLKRKFGKGPETCSISIKDNKMIVHFRNFMTPAEEVLIKNNNVNLAFNFRLAIMNSINHEFEQETYKKLNLSFCSYFYDLDYETNAGILLLEIKESIYISDTHANDSNFPSSTLLETNVSDQIGRISREIHKTPNNINIIKINKNIIVVECKGILLEIERVLYRKGHLDILSERSREIKQSYCKYLHLFEEVLKKPLESFFITWDFKNDKNYLVFYLK